MALAWQPFTAQFVHSALGRPVTICLDGQKVEQTFAGKMCFRDRTGVWYSVCADVRSPVAAGQVCTLQPVNPAKVGGGMARAGAIVARCFRDAQSADQCAGLQLAVWKAIEDGGDYPDFASGALQARASASVIGWAQQYYLIGMSPAAGAALQSGQAGAAAGGAGAGSSSILLAAGGGGGGGGGGGQSQLAPQG